MCYCRYLIFSSYSTHYLDGGCLLSTADLVHEGDDSGIWDEVATPDPDWDVYQINPDTSEGGASCGSPTRPHSDALHLQPTSSINGKHQKHVSPI